MRRLIPIAAFALLLAVPLWAQHGGGHAGGGHAGGSAGHAGFSGVHGGGFSGGHIGGGMRSAPSASRGFARRPAFSQRSFSNRTFLHDRFRGRRGRTFGFRNDCFGIRCSGFYYPWAYGGYYDPYWWWDSSSYDYDEDYERQLALAEEMDQRSLEQQRFLDQQDEGLYALPSASSSREQASDNETHEPSPATVLVFRDQRREEVQNYAIVGQTLWIFSPLRTEKIPLAEIDLAASAKANEDRGVEFRVPGTAEGQ